MYEEKGEQRKVARVGSQSWNRSISFEKKLNNTKIVYKEQIARLREALKFEYSIMDELFTFVGHKANRYYVWTAMVFTRTGKPFYFYRLCPHRNTDELFEFDLDLPKVQRVYCDEAFTYDKMYAQKAIQAKGSMTNIIENLNSQLRDKIAYLVRRTKAHAKSVEWLDYRLAGFFINKNLSVY